jgi:hypothetical protein
LAASGYRFAEDTMPVEQRVIMHGVSYLPTPLLALLRKRCPHFRFGQDDAATYPYLMNRCTDCRAAIPDSELYPNNWGAAFSLPEPGDSRRFRLFKLPVTEPVPVYGAVLFGIDDYPAIEAAKSW